MEIIKLYNDKLAQYGENDFRSLNWSDKEGRSAQKRYEQMSKYVDFEKNSIFEYGCGWGSFFDFGFKCRNYVGCQNYVGYDINKNFIDIAKKKYPRRKWITKIDSKLFQSFDLCISSGVAGNRGGPAWSPSLLKEYLHQMSLIAKKTVVNFPSNRATIRSEHVEYFSPEYVLGQALTLTENVQLIHKYKSDFLLILSYE
tara:strand:- start:187 stop:783 length:597 start_codon:yes stop_codon:yes gene_type:complete